MFEALNKNTGQIFNSVVLYLQYTKEFIENECWYAIPTYIIKANEGVDKTNIPVIFRKPSKDIISINGNIFAHRAHFYIPNAKKLGIAVQPDIKQHIQAQNLIISLLKNKKELVISVIEKPTKYTNFYQLDYDKFDLFRVDIEVGMKHAGRVRADILLPLKEYDVRIGYGIVFEIQFSEQSYKEELQRTFDRATKGYSVVWLKPCNFVNIKSDILELNDNPLIIDTREEIYNKKNQYNIDLINEKTINYFKAMEEKSRYILKQAETYYNAMCKIRVKEEQ